MKLSVETYEDLIRRSGLVEPAQLERVSAELVAKYRGRSFDSEVLAEHLIEQRLITLWQNQIMIEGRFDSLFGGRHAGFFLGNYKLLSHLGSGGMNSVYLAEHTVMRRLVAVKVLPLNSEKDSAFLERFRLESRAIAALDHPNIVRAHDFGNDGDVYYLVMEYVEGKDLHHVVKEKGPLPFSTAADYTRQAADGLAHAHKAGLVHRDVKPANLLLDRRKAIKLLDLGVARFDCDDQVDGSMTRTSEQAVLGTADYLAPEQAIDSHNVDCRADVYSLGCTLYFLLTGHPPFPRGSLAQRMLMHQMSEPAPIYEDRPNAPAGLVAICQKMMSKKPGDRYCSAEEVSAALTQWLSNLSAQAEEEVQQLKARGVQNSDTHSGLGPSTTMGTTLKRKKKEQAQARSDERIQCRTCGTIFGRYMYRAKCPKCNTINHPMAEFGATPHAEYEFGTPATGSGDTDVNMQLGAETQADPSIKASCPGCGATFTARWGKCLVCGMGTILHEQRPTSAPPEARYVDGPPDGRPHSNMPPAPGHQRPLSEALSLWNTMSPPTSYERQKILESP
ncbi:MAG TPA: serine/threonine-protein kinase, partial [Pirellulales bacterium]